MINNLVTIKILDEVNVVIIGLSIEQLEFLWDKYGIFTANYFFNPKYKLKVWDGKIRFFEKTGKTYFNLLPEIIPVIKSWGCKIKLVDQRSPVNISVPLIDRDYFKHLDWTLGDHQVTAVNTLTQNAGGIVVAGTGSGKTCITACLCDLYNKHAGLKTIVVVPNSDLVTQTISEFEELEVDVGEYSGDVKDVNHSNVISTWQALQHNPQILSMFHVLIIDECHGERGPVLHKMTKQNASHCFIRIGLTGTMPKDECENRMVTTSLGQVLYTVPAHELMAKNWLAQLKIQCYVLHEDLIKQWNSYQETHAEEASKTNYKSFRKDYFTDYDSEVKYTQTKKIRNQFIADMITETRTSGKGNTFVLVKNVAYGKKLASLIPNAIFVDGKDKKEVRRKIYSLFAHNDDMVVIATKKLAAVGLNIKRIFHMFLIDLGKSFIEVIQAIGRALRRAPDKDSVNVYDISSDLYYSNKHLNERIKYYKEQKYTYKITKDIKYENMYNSSEFDIDY